MTNMAEKKDDGNKISDESNKDESGSHLKKQISPYDLYSSDNPGNIITQVQLKGENYDEWARAVRGSLRARRKFRFVDGSIKKPDDAAPEIDDWWTVNSMIVSWIFNTIEPKLRSTITYRENAQELWDDIKQRFSISNGPRIQQLKSELANCKQNGDSIVTYFGRLKKLWDELNDFDQIPMCTCNGCKCGISAALNKKREEEKLHQFLMGLDDTQFRTVRSNVLSLDPLPNLNRAYQMVVQEERVGVMTRGKEERGDPIAFAVKSGRTSSWEKKPNTGSEKPCSHCKRDGHDIDSCFQLVGYPDWWGDRPRSVGRALGRGKHVHRPMSGAVKGRGNNAKVNMTQVVDDTEVMKYEDDQVLPGLSSKQWNALLNAINTQKGGTSTRLTGENSWIIDTGASHHMTSTLACMNDVRDIEPCPVGMPNGTRTYATKEGMVTVGDKLMLKHVLFVPNLNCNLISISQLLHDADYIVHFTKTMCVIQDRTSRMMIGAGEQSEGLYVLSVVTPVRAYQANGIRFCELWHRRMGHPSSKITSMLPDVIGKNIDSRLKTCDVCFRAKQIKESFSLSENNAKNCFDLIHCDLWGPYRTHASCGAAYFLTIVDDCSRALWVYLLKTKDEVPHIIKQFFAMIHRQHNKQIKVLRSDNGTEFRGLKSYFQEKGVLHQTSIRYTPQQNGRVERKHRHILNVARALRFQANLPLKFWGECILTAAYLINRTPSALLDGKTPYEVLFDAKPAYTQIRTFGCLCYALNENRGRDKFDSRSRKCIFVGYPYGKKGWEMYDIETEEYFVSRNVKFVEDIFPFSSNDKVSETHVDEWGWPLDPIDECEERNETRNVVTTNDLGAVVVGNDVQDIENHEEVHVMEQQTETIEDVDQGERLDSQQSIRSDELLGRGHRIKNPSTRLKDHVTHTATVSLSTSSPLHSKSSGTRYPIAHFINCDKFSVQHRAFLAAITAGYEPNSFAEAVKDEKWRNAMKEEIQALEDNGTWTTEDLPLGKKAIGCKWIYKIKYNSDGSIERHKARLVIHGNRQVEGVDYNETFAPTAKMVTVRTFLAIAAAKNFQLHQMDVRNAFLHGDLEEEVYMKLPPGFEKKSPGKVCRLRKSLYGLKQAPRCWFAKLSDALKTYGFEQSYSDYSLFMLRRRNTELYVLVYVDDIVISGNQSDAIHKFRDYLGHCFHMKDLGKLKYFLGIEVARNATCIFLSQRKYALDLISDCGLLGAKPATIPLEQNHQLALVEGEGIKDPTGYRSLIGRLIYLTITHPELSYCVHILAQFMQAPKIEHWNAALRVVRYLKGNPGQGILLRTDCDLRLYGYCDADWAGCPLTRRSLTAYFVMLGSSPISWKTKKQTTVSRSSAEAEYRSMAAATCELKWLKGLLSSLGVEHTDPMQLYCDSQSALHIANNPVLHERTKHIEVDCHFVRDEIVKGSIQPLYVHTSKQLADILTKALGKRQFDSLLSKLGVLHLHAPT